LPETKFTKSQATELLYDCGICDLPKSKDGYIYGRDIFSKLLPEDFSIEFETGLNKKMEKYGMNKGKYREEARVLIEKGELKTGIFDNVALEKLVMALMEKYGKEFVRDFYDKANKLASKVLTFSGTTICMDEFSQTKEFKEVINSTLSKIFKASDALIKKYNSGTMELVAGKTYEESFEMRMTDLGSEFKTEIEEYIVKERIKEIFTSGVKKGSTLLALSGAKGKIDNIVNLQGFWGQVAVRETRPSRGFYHRVLSFHKKGDKGAEARGFVKTNFSEGMTPIDFFFHTMGARQGQADTAVSTKDSGYLYRRFSNALRDLFVGEDLSTRSAANEIIQFLYGEDGVFPANTYKGKNYNPDKIVKEL
jgi:DNA-directed RNA polymerase subunit A'